MQRLPTDKIQRLLHAAGKAVAEAISNAWLVFKPLPSVQISVPIPPPWDFVWQSSDRNTRRFGLALVGFLPAGCAASWLGELVQSNGSIGLFLMVGYMVLLAFLGERSISLICPRCGHRFNPGRRFRTSCQHCGLLFGQRDDT